jgi:hypothetical protein
MRRLAELAFVAVGLLSPRTVDDGDEQKNAAPATAEAAPPLSIRLETAHFRVETNTSAERAAYFGSLLERFVEAIRMKLALPPARLQWTTDEKRFVRVFATPKQFWRYYARFVGGRQAEFAGGYYASSEREIVLYDHPFDEDQLAGTLLHEGMHLMNDLFRKGGWLPPWAEEGFAEYFGAAYFDGEKLQDPGIQPERLALVRGEIGKPTFIPLEKLLTISYEEFLGLQESLCYAEAWSFVYFLENSNAGAYSRNTAHFYREAAERGGSIEVFKAALAPNTLDQLQAEWIDYLKNRIERPHDLLRFARDAFNRGHFEEAEEGYRKLLGDSTFAIEARYGVARSIAVIGKKLDEGLALIDSVVRKRGKPDDFAVRGMIRFRRGDLEEAVADVEQALALDPVNEEYPGRLAAYEEALERKK